MKTHLKIACLFVVAALQHRQFVRKEGAKSLWRSLYLNLNQFTLSEALKLPIYVHKSYRLKSISGKIIINQPLSRGLVKFGTFEIGTYDKKSDTGIIDLQGDSTLTFEGEALFGVGCRLSLNSGGHMSFGENFVVTASSTFICSNRITFGHSCLLSWENLFMDTDLHTIEPKSTKKEEIHIGNRNWIGCRCTILKGTETGENCVIGANSQISSSFTENDVLIAGIPAKIVKKGVSWS